MRRQADSCLPAAGRAPAGTCPATTVTRSRAWPRCRGG